MTRVEYCSETEADRLQRRRAIYDPRTDEDPDERQRIVTRVRLVESLVAPDDPLYGFLLDRAARDLSTSYLDYLKGFTK